MHRVKYNKVQIINTVHDNYQTPTCFDTWMLSSGSLLAQKTVQHTTPGINRLHSYDYNIKML